jgi:drug/metabolite transporter (DMT)-like permease
VTSLKYTTVTYVTLIASFTTPCSMILSKFLLKRKYRINHYFGVVICLLGLLFLVLMDYFTSDNSSESSQSARNILIGNILCCFSAFCFACQNVGIEYLMEESQMDSFEILSSLGFFGILVSSFQLCEIYSSNVQDYF